MSEFVKIAVLAIVQGITEFLPISSSGHLGLAEHILGFKPPGITFEIVAHAGTLLSVLLYYRRRLATIIIQLPQKGSDGRREAGLLLLGFLPIAIAGLICREHVTPLFHKPVFIAAMLIITGLVLLTLFLPHRQRPGLGIGKALLIGMAQALAILPGISRSGMTICLARHLGLPPQQAAEFSLLMMVPAIAGALLLQVFEVTKNGLGDLTIPMLLTTFALSAAVGYAAIAVLVKALATGHFRWFGFYCLVAGIAGLILL